jgi:hypothetical protein
MDLMAVDLEAILKYAGRVDVPRWTVSRVILKFVGWVCRDRQREMCCLRWPISDLPCLALVGLLQ